MGTHSKLSPSAANRWLICPGSLKHPDGPESKAAISGTHSHAVLELVLTGKAPLVGDLIPSGKVMTGHVEQAVEVRTYLENYINRGYAIETETKIEIGAFWGLPKLTCAGTADVIAYNADTLVVCDAKFGFVQIYPEGNPQLMLYALGALHELALDIKTVILVIAQPNYDGEMQFREHTISRHDLLLWATNIADAVMRAAEGNSEIQFSEKGCKWCSGKATCPAYLKAGFDALQEEWLTGHSIEELLPFVDQLRDICNSLEKQAVANLSQGIPVPGYKLVASRSTRKWGADETDIIKQAIELAPDKTFKPLDFYDAKLLSPAKMEKLLGKKSVAKLPVITPEGAPKLAPDSDPRPALKAGEFTVDDITEVE